MTIDPFYPAFLWPFIGLCTYTYLCTSYTFSWNTSNFQVFWLAGPTYAGNKNGVPTKFFRTSAFIYS